MHCLIVSGACSALMRFEFLEAILRLGIAKYVVAIVSAAHCSHLTFRHRVRFNKQAKEKNTASVCEAVRRLFQEHIFKSPSIALHDPDEFRRVRLYKRDVHVVFLKVLPQLKRVFSLYVGTEVPPRSRGGAREVGLISGRCAGCKHTKAVDNEDRGVDADAG